jgi:hypothetical protein
VTLLISEGYTGSWPDREEATDARVVPSGDPSCAISSTSSSRSTDWTRIEGFRRDRCGVWPATPHRRAERVACEQYLPDQIAFTHLSTVLADPYRALGES